MFKTLYDSPRLAKDYFELFQTFDQDLQDQIKTSLIFLNIP